MTSALQEKENINFGGQGGIGMGGALGGILLAIIVLWFLIKDGHNNGGHNNIHTGGYGGYNGFVPDQPNYSVDKDVINQGCMTREKEACEAEKTRALIVHESERNADKEYYTNLINTQSLLSGKDSKIQGLEAMIYGNNQFNTLQKEISLLECQVSKLPQAQPEYAQMCTPVVRPVGDCYPHNRGDFC